MQGDTTPIRKGSTQRGVRKEEARYKYHYFPAGKVLTSLIIFNVSAHRIAPQLEGAQQSHSIAILAV
ncbi:Uncharacterized protein BM_BM17596 [Brugia malayi]|uniref:Uncharacterized protein n=1 Tax=Brugia malayi TaxID=6279 RepID=A0A4E9FGF5_BRUMA|nr:Uncharacterized protein BM_BM17596 [Brugia malayi]VIO95319.1 Uncharacterized protein BM_BM17596 [Brugia malayi]